MTLNIVEPDRNSSIPWYRHHYVWLLIAFPAIAVVAGFITLFIAIRSNDGLVVDDYYKQGLEINRTFARDKVAKDLGLQAELQVSEGRDILTVGLTGNRDFQPPGQITVSFIHPTSSGFDHKVYLSATNTGIYTGRFPDLVPGTWNVILEARDWRLVQRWHN